MRKWDKIAADQAAADEIRDPGCTARKKAAHSRERMIRKARQSTEEQYRQLLTGIVQGKRPSPIKLTQLMTALSKSEQDVADDVELRAAEMEDEAEVIRCKDEKASLQKQIDEAEAAIREAEVAQTKSGRHYDELQEKIAAIHSKVALDEKRDLAKALSRNQSATLAIQQGNETIRELRNKMADVRPRTMSVARLKTQRDRIRREAIERRDLAEARLYMEPELPHGELAAIIAPQFDETGETEQRPNERKIRMGSVNGEPTFATVKLG